MQIYIIFKDVFDLTFDLLANHAFYKKICVHGEK